ncbi:conserved Plasmodium protein, unknown function [Plasmodium vivax]|uniref:Uncharacterized protein n=3 Tax=Plasmodium vivax TaxID=5855 RepID=A5K4F1_PLAVS|nr:hypothetical protein, conserved [Plasmodium vivax]EDL45529.1 hypothetical protein, conserved [Plasmodium vivax]KMZ93180.1 hypothetical protein PVMG_04926 [Plasmodium vivax Mauritania I]CAI7720420.1 conserved Plasmodium protein, unknown function [Plasmodium vivax]SCO67236.1 conserved Plasmodium protein, unknown function [Plasmodium vivax]|eukprot:XP_001615256.1 hypothetical protein [Plasmodium vivax Sal-1]
MQGGNVEGERREEKGEEKLEQKGEENLEQKWRKKREDAYIQRINFSEITGHGETDKRIEYLWNLALCTVYENTKLSMKYITLIKKITKNNVLFDNVCCHHCNLIYIPFYNCEIKKPDEKNFIVYRCFLCKRKKRQTLRDPKNKGKNAPLENSDGRNVPSNPRNWGLFFINEIDEYEIGKKTPGDQTGDIKVEDHSQGNIPSGGVNVEDYSKGNIPSGGVNAEDNFPGDIPVEEPPNQVIPIENIKDFFTIDYGTASCTINREILTPMIQQISDGKNNNLKNLNSAGENSNVRKKRTLDGSIKWNEKSDTVKEATTKADDLSNAQERAVPKSPPNLSNVNSAQKSNVPSIGKNIPILGRTDNYLNFNKPKKKKKKNILDIL